jgi:nitrite reductase/ring-hydroxylating ferredoxin subunit
VATETRICASAQLEEGGHGVLFNMNVGDKPRPAFVIRFDGVAHAYVNSCPHLGTELDWQPGQFFDESGLYLICATHGAVFAPDSGYCSGGPCRGQWLIPLPVVEQGGSIFLSEGFSVYVE